MTRGRVGILLGVALVAGVGWGLSDAESSSPTLDQSSDVRLNYYLANQALYAGDIEQVPQYMQRVEDLGQDPRTLCPGVTVDLQIQDGTWPFCDPNKVTIPDTVSLWTTSQLSHARALAEEGELDDAVTTTRAVLKLNPYHVEAHQALALWLGQNGDSEAATTHGETAARILKGHTQALEWTTVRRM